MIHPSENNCGEKWYGGYVQALSQKLTKNQSVCHGYDLPSIRYVKIICIEVFWFPSVLLKYAFKWYIGISHCQLLPGGQNGNIY